MLTDVRSDFSELHLFTQQKRGYNAEHCKNAKKTSNATWEDLNWMAFAFHCHFLLICDSRYRFALGAISKHFFIWGAFFLKPC